MKKLIRLIISLFGGVIGMCPAIMRAEDLIFVFLGFFMAFGLTFISVDSLIEQHKDRRNY